MKILVFTELKIPTDILRFEIIRKAVTFCNILNLFNWYGVKRIFSGSFNFKYITLSFGINESSIFLFREFKVVELVPFYKETSCLKCLSQLIAFFSA